MHSQRAYILLGNLDPSSCTDEVVVAAYLKTAKTGSSDVTIALMKEALDAIAVDRKSCLLYFVTGVICDQDTKWTSDHWHEAETRLSATSSPNTLGTPENINPQQGKEVAEGSSSSGTHIMTPQANDHAASGDQDDNLSIGEHGGAGSSEVSDWCMRGDASSTEEETDSHISDSADSDWSHERKGYIWNSINSTWCCQECDAAVINGICPNGHVEHYCIVCDQNLEDGVCPECGPWSTGRFAHEDGEEPDQITYDYDDNIWRCVSCHWEVEATSEQGGHCFCGDDQGERHFHDLSGCSDYEPAEAFDSEMDSEDSETDSGDESFIDDPEDDTVDDTGSVIPSQSSDPTEAMPQSRSSNPIPTTASDAMET